MVVTVYRDLPVATVDTVSPAGGVGVLTLGAAVTCTLGDLLGWDGSQWTKADADANPVIPARFMAMETQPTAAGVVKVCQAGTFFKANASLTNGAQYYLSTTAGSYTAANTPPVASGTLTLIQPIGIAVSTSVLMFDLAKRTADQLRFQFTYDPASLSATTARQDTGTVTGLLTTDIIRGMPEVAFTGVGWNSGLIIQSLDVSSSNTLRIRLQNASAGSLDGASVTIEALVERL